MCPLRVQTVGAAAMTKTMPTKNGVGRVPVCNAWHDKEFGLEWKMDKEDRELSLSRRST